MHAKGKIALFKRRESEVRGYCRGFPKLFTKAVGSTMWDADGRSYIDFLAGCGSLNYGHNQPQMKAALLDHIASDGVAMGLDLHTDAKHAFIEAFERVVLAPRGMDHLMQFTGPTGANAVEAALKLARKVTGRTNVVAFTNGFHGVTAGALAVTGSAYNRMSPVMPLAGVTRMPFDGYANGTLDAAGLLETMLADPSGGIDPPAAIIMESVQGEGGLNAASADFVRRVAAAAKACGALFILDDVQAGCGRTGTFFSHEEMGIDPDIIVLSKSLSGFGLPMSLVLIAPEHDAWSPAEHNGTFRGNNHAFVTARVAIERYWNDETFSPAVAERGEMVRERLEEIAGLVPGARLKGRGMMRGVDVGTGELAGAICRAAFENGLIIETSGPNDEVVKVLAALNTPHADLTAGLDMLVDAAERTVRLPVAAE